MKKLLIFTYIGNLVAIIGFWFFNSRNIFINASFPALDYGEVFYAIGRLLGLIGMCCVLFQLVLIGRVKWLEGRYGFDKLAKLHQENGRIALGVLIVHPIFLILGNMFIQKVDFSGSFINLIQTNPFTILAPVGLILTFVIVLISNPLIMNRIDYEKWYYFHLFQYLAISLVIAHQFFSGTDIIQNPLFMIYWIGLYIFVGVNFLYFRLLRPLYLYQKHHFKIKEVEEETHDSVSLYISGDNMSELEYKSGQFLLIRILKSSLWWQVHPFSISSMPNDEYVRLTVKDVGDYSSKVVKANSGLRVLIDGPLGRFTKKISKKQKVLFIAAGSGITPIRSLMEELAIDGKDIVLFYGNKTKKDIIFFDELETLADKYEIPIHYFFSREKELEKKSNYYKGRIQLNDIQDIVTDLFEREIFMCAPPEMMRTLRIELPKIGFPPKYIYYEQYNW
ncbi:MAG: hypothetical protein GF329_00350 [Candidatus Lokiarchaeota archaeon]|nr:hypothetical protein [Candidatus Lokiarchaeota archaeon]